MKHLLLLAFPLALAAQVPTQSINPCFQQACFFVTASATVSSSSTMTLTVQQPATGAKQVNFMAAVATCDQNFTLDQSQNGTAATATPATPIALLPRQQTQGGTNVSATATAFSASNVGGGTATAQTFPYAAASIAVIDLSMRSMGATGTGTNYSLKLTNTSGSSCSGAISIYWSEVI